MSNGTIANNIINTFSHIEAMEQVLSSVVKIDYSDKTSMTQFHFNDGSFLHWDKIEMRFFMPS